MKKFWKWLAGGAAAIAVAIGITVGTNNPPEPPPVDPSAFRVELLTPGTPAGHMAPLLGLSVRDPLNKDTDGLRVDEGPLGQRFLALPMATYRHTAGSQSYGVKSLLDPGMQYTLLQVLPQLPLHVSHDFTYPPTLPIDQVPQWVTARTGRISLANEPPIHVGPNDAFKTVEDYATWATSVVAANPGLADRFWVQSGKPEIIAGATAPASAKTRHQQVESSVSAAIRAGRLPARIITTHKLLPDYGEPDWYKFYTQLLADYRTAYGADVRVCFQEYNWMEAETLHQDVLLSVSHFLLVMSRLRYEQGDIVDGAAYHQGSSVKPTAIIGLNAAGEWTATPLTELWEQFGDLLLHAQYVPSTLHNRPTEVAVEVFQTTDGKRYALFSNRSDSAATVLLPGAPAFDWLVQDLTVSGSAKFDGTLPPKSCGVIAL